MLSLNTLNDKWIKHANQKTGIDRMGEKTNTQQYAVNKTYTLHSKKRAESKMIKKCILCEPTIKRARVAMFISNNIDFKINIIAKKQRTFYNH